MAKTNELLRILLGTRGYTVLDSGDPWEALRMARDHKGPFPLMITDINMPGLDGHVLAERLAADRPETRVIYTSGDHAHGLGIVDNERFPRHACTVVARGLAPASRQKLNFATAACSRAAISLNCREAVLVSLAPSVVLLAELATPPMFLAMSLTPWAASLTLRPISLVVAVCSSTAEAMLLEMSLI
jgi:CheY-like chemotaxis protein